MVLTAWLLWQIMFKMVPTAWAMLRTAGALILVQGRLVSLQGFKEPCAPRADTVSWRRQGSESQKSASDTAYEISAKLGGATGLRKVPWMAVLCCAVLCCAPGKNQPARRWEEVLSPVEESA